MKFGVSRASKPAMMKGRLGNIMKALLKDADWCILPRKY